MAVKANHTIAVIGSLNVDFITRTPRLPAAGETLTATSFETGLGGKGANQAVACARVGGDEINVQMAGNVGDDSFGNDYVVALENDGVGAAKVCKIKGARTGIANIIVDESTGDNRIMLFPGANHAFSKEKDQGWEMVPTWATSVVVFQLEIPMEVVLYNLREAGQGDKHVVMNPAPAKELPEDAYHCIDTLIMNETEAAILARGSASKLDPSQMTSHFLQRGVKDIVIITLGGEGLVYATSSGSSGHVAARKVKVVDTTAAGDTFVGAYAARRARYWGENFDHEEALQFATLAASKTVERAGAMAAIPYLKEL